ncbi:TIGR02391 family protein (plasmid) [Pseudarthrobacter sp. O4]|uniref:TIGR02391 family protein n=1 Tax=Pseudarthrobacter sp. O4 TaxID=3418417 RepID=UPI003CFA15F6
MTELNADEIRHLPLPDLAMKVLVQWSGWRNLHNLMLWMRQTEFPDESDVDVLQDRVADAWAWLEAHALLAKDPRDGSPWQRVSELGTELINDPNAITKLWAAERLAGDLDAALGSAKSNFALGDYETAAFAAMKAVEVEVRRVAGLPNELLGVNLMRKAFSPKDGILRDPEAEGGEQQATADLFAGAMGAYKNPASHRTVQFDDPVEAAEVIQLADLLLRILHRAERRAAHQRGMGSSD